MDQEQPQLSMSGFSLHLSNQDPLDIPEEPIPASTQNFPMFFYTKKPNAELISMELIPENEQPQVDNDTLAVIEPDHPGLSINNITPSERKDILTWEPPDDVSAGK